MEILHDKDLDEVLVESKKGFEGNLLRIRVDTVRLPNGNLSTREVASHQGAVAVIPVLPDGSIIFERQFRYAVGGVIYEIPAGKLDPGEKPDDCVVRELSEETGYEAGKMEYLTSIVTTPGFTNEVIHLYIAKDLKKHEQHLDPDEFIKVDHLPWPKVAQMVRDGKIFDSKTLAALGYAVMTGKLPPPEFSDK